MIGVWRWTIHRRLTEYGLEDMRGFDSLPDKEPKSFKSMDIISLQVSLSPFVKRLIVA